ncbi:SDR family NAD(P)-dependent oxidoreductase, partial [Thermodesulfobacteriota bacterium]
MILSKFSLEDKIAIVTGSGRGIGKGIALGLARAGAHVVGCARTLEQAEATAAEIRELGPKSIAIQTDVRDNDQVRNMVKKTVEEFGRLDVIVNNAGGGFTVPALDMSERAWDALIRENMRPVFLCCKAAAEVMVPQKKGAIINISSIAGLGGGIGSSGYGSAKAGVIN